MGDMGDDFNAWKKHKQEKRASNRDNSAELLMAEGIEFESKNIGAHLIVKGGGKIIDFWPGTGLWIVRGSINKRRGVRQLIAAITATKE